MKFLRKQVIITFLMSPQGQKLLKAAYRKLNTPANQAKLRSGAERARRAASNRKPVSRRKPARPATRP